MKLFPWHRVLRALIVLAVVWAAGCTVPTTRGHLVERHDHEHCHGTGSDDCHTHRHGPGHHP